MRFAALRHLISILLLPFMIVVVVPAWILRSWVSTDVRWGSGFFAALTFVMGVLVFVMGLALFTWCVLLFGRMGQGTLAPWDATRKLVAVGPYSYMRNPMISAVTTMLAGEALFFRSLLLAGWSIAFVIVNHVYFVTIEEPGLRHRFGSDYDEYWRRVPRWVPRLGRR